MVTCIQTWALRPGGKRMVRDTAGKWVRARDALVRLTINDLYEQKVLQEIFDRHGLPPAERDFEQKNFADWQRSCRTCDERSLIVFIEATSRTLAVAHGRHKRYFDIRMHFLQYAARQLVSRFPTDDDVIPF